MRWSRTGLVALGVLVGSEAAWAQALRLTVQDSSTGEAIANATVAVLSSNHIVASGITGKQGQLVLRSRDSGPLTAYVRRLGYAPTTSAMFSLSFPDTVNVLIRLPRIPQFLPDVAIRAEREDIRNQNFFGMKIGTLSATVISPTQVDRSVTGAKDYTDLVSRNQSAGFAVDYDRKCVLSTRGDPPGCLPVIIDGLVTQDVAEVLPPEIIDYIIILRGNEIGVMYGTVGENGAVLVFTKRGVKRGPQ